MIYAKDSSSKYLNLQIHQLLHADKTNSDCSLYDVNIFDTRDGNTEPAINWNNNNWYIQGPYQYFSPPRTNDQAG